MKQKKMIVALIGSIAALNLVGCVATWTPPSVVISAPPPPVVEVAVPAVVVAPPPPVVSVASPAVVVAPIGVAIIPEAYAWDGFEYVGVVGGNYVYFGPGGAWLPCEPWRLGRFHGWERGHSDWRSHPEHFGGGHGGHPGGHGGEHR